MMINDNVIYFAVDVGPFFFKQKRKTRMTLNDVNDVLDMLNA